MSASVFGGAAQLLALGSWTTPASVVTATLAAFTVNLRLVLMGPVLGPWLDKLRGWPVWGSLFLLVDQNWGLALRDLNAGGRDAGFMFGSGLAMWLQWVLFSAIGHAAGATLQLPSGHPLFFCSLAVFVCMLAGQWRNLRDLLPWAVAAAVAITTAQLWPGSVYYIVAGALAGSLTGAIRDTWRAGPCRSIPPSSRSTPGPAAPSSAWHSPPMPAAPADIGSSAKSSPARSCAPS